MTCAQCGAALQPSARFCGACGHRVASVEQGAWADPTAGLRPASPQQAAASGYHAEPDPYLGMTLNGRFSIERKLGEGGFGAVYQGTQLLTGRPVAVKLLHPEMGRDPNVVARFRREGEVLCSLRDAHTITTYDFDRTPDGTLFIAMELLQGRSLHDVFAREAPIAWPRMMKIICEMCSSLEEAHGLGIVHRDLKLENIYLERRPGNDEFVKVLDFGIAKVVRGEGGGAPQLTATGQTLGTLEYMSPEQLMGRALDGRSDIYALGVVAFELMTGRLPFPEATQPGQLIAAQLKRLPPAPSSVSQAHIPRGVDALVGRMLEKNVEARFAGVGELRQEIERLLACGGLAAPHGLETDATIPHRPRPRRPSLAEAADAAQAVGPRPPGSAAGDAGGGPRVGTPAVSAMPNGSVMSGAPRMPGARLGGQGAAAPLPPNRRRSAPPGGDLEPGETAAALAAATTGPRRPLVIAAAVVVALLCVIALVLAVG